MRFIDKIKKSKISGIFFGIIVGLLAGKVFAGPGEIKTPPPPSSRLVNPMDSQSFSELVESIAKLVAKIGIPVAALFIIYAGLLFVTARGNEKQLEDAKKNFIWAMAGTAVLLGAWVIAKAISATVQSF